MIARMNASRLWPLALCLLTLGLAPRATAQPGGSSNAKPLVVNSDGTIAGPVSASTFKTANSIGTGGGGSSAWGDITGTLSNQTDLNTALGLRVLTSTLNGYFADPSTNGSFSASAWRSDLGLVIGTNVQAYSANLLTFAAIAPSSNVQSLLGAVDYAAMRVQLGLGGAALLSVGTGSGTVAAGNDSRITGAASASALVAVNPSGVNNGGLVDWSQLMNVPAGFADGSDDGTGGSGVSDGDKGDITVSGSGTAWTIDNGAVSLAKMANMATASLLGRNTSGTGTPEVLAASTARSLLGLATVATSGSASDLSTGTLPDARFPATLPALNGSALTALNASNLGSGTIPDARFPATLPAASGANLTALNGSNISSGTVADARIASTLTRNADFDTAAERAALGFKTTTHGGLEALQDHSTMGATETFDLATANAHIGTLDANLTVTLTGFTSGKFCSTIIGLLQNGTGGWTVTWPAAVVDAPTVTSTAGAITWVSLWSTDGGTTIYASSTADGGSGASVSDTAFASSWNGVTTDAPSKNAVYDWAHILDTDDDGKVNLLDNISTAGMPKVDSSGNVTGTAIADTDFHIAPAGAAISSTTIDWTAGTAFHKTLAANTTFTFSNAVTGRPIDVAVTNTASNYTAAFTGVIWPGASAPTLTTGAKTDVFRFIKINGQIYGSVVGQNYSPPDTTAPTLSTATIGTNGTTLTLVFDETVSIGAGGNGGFALTLSAGTSTPTYTSGSGSNTLVYTLGTVVNSGITGTIAYTQPGNGVEDGSGNDLATFSGTSITNNSTQVPTLSSATIGTNGTTWTFVFSQSVTVGAGGNGGFAATLSSGSTTLTYSSGSGSTTLVYTGGTVVNSGVTGTLAYTQPGNGIEATTGGADVASFSGTTITNNSTQTGGGYVEQETRGDGSWGDATDFSFYTRIATEFTPSTSYTATAVDVWLREIGSPAAGTIQVAIYSNNSNNPDSLVGTASATIDRTTFPGTDTATRFTGLSASLTSGTKYWLVVISSTADSGSQLIWTNVSGAFLRRVSETGASWDTTANRGQNFKIFSGSP
jgi:hypothetical protein